MHVHTPSDIPKQKPHRQSSLSASKHGGLLILSICFPSKIHIHLNDENVVSVTLSNGSNLGEIQYEF